MARIVSVPDQHDCFAELRALGQYPIGAVAECSCGIRYVVREHQLDGRYWSKQFGKKVSEG